MMDIDAFTDTLDALCEELPECFFEHLNGGINVLRSSFASGEAPGLYVLGHYCSGGPMGRYINIYYGSFRRLFPDLDDENLKKEMRKVLRHEFRHHVESLAGDVSLKLEDDEALAEYRKRYFGGEPED